MGNFSTILLGYEKFREKYAQGDQSVMQQLAHYGQKPTAMVVACCDSRVDPALILQCNPGDLFVVRNVANIVPPYQKDDQHHGTSAALEFGICYLHVSHLVLLGHSQCGGIQALLDHSQVGTNDFISNWVSLITTLRRDGCTPDEYTKLTLQDSYKNCLSFPWIATRVQQGTLRIHRWFFDIKVGEIFAYSEADQAFLALSAPAL